MREKRLRKQELEEQAKSSAKAEPSQKQAAEGTLKGKVPAKVALTSPGSPSLSSTAPAPDTSHYAQRLPVRKRIPLKSKAASPLNSTTTPGARGAAVSPPPPNLSSSPPEVEAESGSQSPGSSREVPDKNTRNSTTVSPAKQARAPLQDPTAEVPTADKTLNSNQKKSPEHTTDTKGTTPLTLSCIRHFQPRVCLSIRQATLA